MSTSLSSPRRSRLAAVLALAALAGCASTTLDAQWRDPQVPGSYLRGAKVLVTCEAADVTLKRICEDQLVAELTARGATTVITDVSADAGGMRPAVPDAQYLPAARSSGAKAVVSMSVGVSSQAVNPGWSIGVGGFGFGRHSAGGVGVSAPLGGGGVTAGYSASSRVTDVASGRLMWSARATTPPSSDLNAQLADLSKTVVDAAQKAGLF
ncbi:MAG TPA: hypothetical protein VJO99_13430 [Burkholderiaceae bacterium]|nr:hypothetical protein [Burkholderiaceae bacterium]